MRTRIPLIPNWEALPNVMVYGCPNDYKDELIRTEP